MKNILLITIIMFKALSICISQNIDEEIEEISTLFAIDYKLLDNYYDIYTESDTPFSYKQIIRLDKNNLINKNILKILIIADANIYSQVKYRIDRYAYIINYIFGCEVIMIQVSGGNHENIKSLIMSESDDLNGVVLIGNIPVAVFEIDNDFGSYGYRNWPCDLYYMDIDGVWEDTTNNGFFDYHTGNETPEIFIGRISTANMGSLLDEKAGLENYLDKNYKYWLGHLTVNRKYGLTYTAKDWANSLIHKTDIQYLYGSTNFDSVTYYNYDLFGKNDYLERLSNERYEFIQISAHSGPTTHVLREGESIRSNEIFNNGTEAIGYNLFSCSACRWTVVSQDSHYGFLCGAYIYNNNPSSLVVVGSTKIGSMRHFKEFYVPLGEGKTFGEALVQWWNTIVPAGSHSTSQRSWYYGLTIIGDPLVYFSHCMNDICDSQITLTTWDYLNTSPAHYFFAENNITINPVEKYVIPTGMHAIFNAKTVEITKNFETQTGSSFEILNDGCKSNCPE